MARSLPPEETAYYRFLPMIYPYLLKSAPDTFVAQFGDSITYLPVAQFAEALEIAQQGNAGIRRYTARAKECNIRK